MSNFPDATNLYSSLPIMEPDLFKVFVSLASIPVVDGTWEVVA